MGEGTPLGEVELAALRGGLAPSTNTARDLAATAQTPCPRRRALAVVGARTEDAAARLPGPAAPSGQSPFAITVGTRFEEILRRDGAARLREALERAVPVELGELELIDLDARHPWRPGVPRPETAAARRSATDALVAACLRGEAEADRLVLHPRLALTVTDTARDVEPDALLCLRAGRGAQPELLLVEITAFVDHGHRTDTHDLASTRLQLAVYALAVRQQLARLELEPQPMREAVVVLRAPGSMVGSASLEEVHRDVSRLERALARAPATLSEVLATLPEGAALDDSATLSALPVRYRPHYCLASCAMALQCRAGVEEAASPEYYGSPTREVFAAIGDLRRAHGLVTGSEASETEEERELVARLGVLRRRIDDARRRCS